MAPPADLAAMVLAVSPLFIVAYSLAFWCTIGQTPGKWLMGIKVVGADGGRVTVTRAIAKLFVPFQATARERPATVLLAAPDLGPRDTICLPTRARGDT